ncbi:GIY-YIG nuclease family protein [Streptomyces sp. NPDC059445]|uniref:GIY-YIG nuclease family protein n=1 Tax=Streptomyces sp. NPDC059445 TaxID=3346832 RepID=UPI0036B33D8D
MKCVICGGPDGQPWGSYGPTPACAPCHSTVVDQQRAALTTKPTALYRLYDAFGRLLYIGMTSDLPRRWKEHRTEHRYWWHQVVERSLEWFPIRRQAWRAEGRAVLAELPLHNNASWGDLTGGRRPELPAGVPPRPEQPEAEEWWSDQAVADTYWLALAIWRAQLRDAGLTAEESAVVIAGCRGRSA